MPGLPLFGINIDPVAGEWRRALALARYADAHGVDWIGVQDHPYNPAFLDTWTLLSAMLMETEKVHVMANVSSLPLRPPAMLAKQAATLDVISAGRLEMGLGAGASAGGSYAWGGPARTPRQAHEALAEAITVLRLLWGQSAGSRPVTFTGTYYRLAGAEPGPLPAHPIQIWLGAMGPRSLSLTGRAADGWSVSNGYVTTEQVLAMQQRISTAAREAGRTPEAVRRSYNMAGMILPALAPGVHLRAFAGSPRAWVDEIARAHDQLGMDAFLFWPLFGDPRGQIQRFVEDVVPRARERLGAGRFS